MVFTTHCIHRCHLALLATFHPASPQSLACWPLPTRFTPHLDSALPPHRPSRTTWPCLVPISTNRSLPFLPWAIVSRLDVLMRFPSSLAGGTFFWPPFSVCERACTWRLVANVDLCPPPLVQRTQFPQLRSSFGPLLLATILRASATLPSSETLLNTVACALMLARWRNFFCSTCPCRPAFPTIWP